MITLDEVAAWVRRFVKDWFVGKFGPQEIQGRLTVLSRNITAGVYDLLVKNSTGNAAVAVQSDNASNLASIFAIADGGYLQLLTFGTSDTGTRYGLSRVDTGELSSVGLLRLILGTTDAAPIVLATNNTEYMRLLTDGKLGHGTATPQVLHHMLVTPVTGTTYSTDDQLTIEKDGNAGINLIGGTSGANNIVFSDTARARGLIQYSHAADSLTFRTAGTNCASFDSSGRLNMGAPVLAVGNYTISSGAITVGNVGIAVVDTEGGAATDDLTSIAGGVTGQMLLVRSTHNSRDVVVKHNAGGSNYFLCGADFTLTTTADFILFVYTGTIWSCVAKSDNL